MDKPRITSMGGGQSMGSRPMIYRGPDGENNADAIFAKLLIPTRDGIITTVSSATVDPIRGANVSANTPNGRDLWIAGRVIPGAALLAQRATSGTHGAANGSTRLLSNTLSVGDYPSIRTLIEDTNTGAHNAPTAAVALSTGVNYVASAYVKRGVGTRNFALNITDNTANGIAVSFDLSTFATASSPAGGTTLVRASVRSLGNGWFLAQMTFTSSAWAANVLLAPQLVSGSTLSYTGDGASSIVISGYQVELGEYATTPLGWDGGAVSRLAASYSWNQALGTTSGTVFCPWMSYGWAGTINAGTPRLYDANANGLLQYDATGQTYTAQRTDSVPNNRAVTSASTPVIAANQKNISQRWDDASSNRVTVDGVTVSSGSLTLPFAAGTPIFIGNRSALDRPGDCWVCPILTRSGIVLTDSEISYLEKTTVIL